jgi:hypothetical protein
MSDKVSLEGAQYSIAQSAQGLEGERRLVEYQGLVTVSVDFIHSYL